MNKYLITDEDHDFYGSVGTLVNISTTSDGYTTGYELRIDGVDESVFAYDVETERIK